MFVISILIPKTDNTGRVFSAEEVAAFEADLVDLFGGFTRNDNPLKGGWFSADENKVVIDETNRYLLALSSITDGAKVAQLATIAKARFEQDAVWVEYLGLAEIL